MISDILIMTSYQYPQNVPEEELVRIISEPKNSIEKQFQWLFKQDGLDLKIPIDAKKTIAKKAGDLGTYARGLRPVSYTHLTLPTKRIV